jgi:hypothetical protein
MRNGQANIQAATRPHILGELREGGRKSARSGPVGADVDEERAHFRLGRGRELQHLADEALRVGALVLLEERQRAGGAECDGVQRL